MSHRSSDGTIQPGKRRRTCGCQSCRAEFGPCEVEGAIEVDGKLYAPAEDGGSRLTDCCGAYSTFCDEDLSCKACYRSVPFGQGDGSETMEEACAS